MESWKVTSEILAERLALCENCDDYKKELKICSNCNCYIPFKTSVIFFECPIGKWNKLAD